MNTVEQSRLKRSPRSKENVVVRLPNRDERPFTGRLLKRIDLTEAKPRGLRAALALPPDKSDSLAYYREELDARIRELKEFLGLASAAHDSERLGKALAEREFGIPRDVKNWWDAFGAYLILKAVPGFSIRANKKKHGAPRTWTHERLVQLFADVEFLKMKTGLSVVKACEILTTKKGYKERWGHGPPVALRRAYVQAQKLLREDVLFFLHLCGGEVLMRDKGADLIQKAIERHALQI